MSKMDPSRGSRYNIRSSSGLEEANKNGDIDDMLKQLKRLKKDCADHAGAGALEDTVSTLISSVEKKIQLRRDLDRLKKSCVENNYVVDPGDHYAPLLHLIESESSTLSSKYPDHHDPQTAKVEDVRSLLVANAGLFYQCISLMSEEYNKEEDNDQDNCEVSFSRYGFDVVKVRSSSTSTSVTTDADCTTRKFDLTPLARLPKNLEDFITPQHKSEPFSNFINYESIFESALMFPEDTLESFLPKLKDHLEAVHECLEEINEWMEKSSVNIKYIEKTFRVKLGVPDYCGAPCLCAGGTHQKSYICFSCQCPFSYHKDRRCPKGNTVFHCKKFHLLKKFSGSGQNPRSFEIGKENEREALEKFLGLMKKGHLNRLESVPDLKTFSNVSIDKFDILTEDKSSCPEHEEEIQGMGESKSTRKLKGSGQSKDTVSRTEISSLGTTESEWTSKSSRRGGRFSFSSFARRSSRASLNKTTLKAP